MHPDSNTPTTTEPRTMTMSDVRKWYVDGERSLLDFLQNNAPVTIVPDPEPRPDFDSMTNAELAVWLAEHDKTTDSSGVRLRLIKRCNIVSDKLGLAR